MRKDVKLKRRLANVAALQALKATASRAELAEAQAIRVEGETALAAGDDALAAFAREMDTLLASDVLDFDRWRIGRFVLEDLAIARDAAARDLCERRGEEAEAQAVFGRERAREDRAADMHRRLARRLGEKRDEAATLEASSLATARKLMRQS